MFWSFVFLVLQKKERKEKVKFSSEPRPLRCQSATTSSSSSSSSPRELPLLADCSRSISDSEISSTRRARRLGLAEDRQTDRTDEADVDGALYFFVWGEFFL